MPPDTCPKCERPVAPGAVYCECGQPIKLIADATAHAGPPHGDARADQLGPAHPGGRHGDLLFGRFRVVEEVGRGGMGVVYKATDEQLNDKVVAVKVLAAHLAKDASAVARLKQEVVAAQGLQHLGIIRVNQFYVETEQVGFDMEYLEGATLAQHLSGGVPDSPFAPPATPTRLPWVASLVAQLAAALDFIHDSGLVHRDIKPSNVMLVPRDDGGFAVKLLDFGIVHIQGGDLTGGAQPGTLSYMAPELINGTGQASPASDLFALGAVVYLALTGEFARFGPESDPPSSLVAGLPSSLNEPLRSCLAARPDRRPQTGTALDGVVRAAAAQVEDEARKAEEAREAEELRLASESAYRKAEEARRAEDAKSAESAREAERSRWAEEAAQLRSDQERQLAAQRAREEAAAQAIREAEQQRRTEAAAAQHEPQSESESESNGPVLRGGLLVAVVVVGIAQERGGLWYLTDEYKPFTGRAVLLFDGGQKASEGEFKDGAPAGTFTDWYENGQKKAEGEFKDGEPHGPLTQWYENGQKEMEGEYKDGELHGPVTWWNENGQKMVEGEYKDGKEHGTETY